MSEQVTKKTLTITRTNIAGKYMEFWFQEERTEPYKNYDGQMYESWLLSCKAYRFYEKVSEAHLYDYVQNNGTTGLITVWVVDDSGHGEIKSVSKPTPSTYQPFELKWVNIQDARPANEDAHYLVWCERSFPKNYKGVVAEWYNDAQAFYDEADEYPIDDATHWAELPTTPTEIQPK